MSFIKALKKIKASYVLAAAFLVYCLYVSAAALPAFIQNTLDCDAEEATFEQYIDVIDAQYHDILSTHRDTPFLQNKATYIDFCGFMANTLGQHTTNGRTKLTNGHLALSDPEYLPEEVYINAENIITFCKQQHAAGGSFLFVLAPSQVYGVNQYLPEGFSAQSQTNADLFLQLLLENNVPVLDLREEMDRQQITYTDAFYTTDHHWKTEYGFWAYCEITKYLEGIGAASPDSTVTSPENYEFIPYEDCFLGSSGKRTGKYFAGTDDFTLIVPKFDTEITVTVESKNINKTGRFEDISATNSLIGMQMRLSDPDYFNDDPYGRIGYGNTPMTNWRNPRAHQDQKYLLIGDSVANIPFTFLSLYNSTCDELDMRHYSGDFEAYFRGYSPDLVIICANQYGLVGSESDNVSYIFFPESDAPETTE